MLQLKTRMIESDNPVGVKKTSNWKLPPIEFVFGKANVPDKEEAGIVIRSWNVHSPSKKVEPPQDFVQINKLAIKMNATSHASNKDFRKTANIKKKIYQGNNERTLYLPGEDFTYGKKIPSLTSIETLINYDYSNKAEEVIKMEYHTYLREVERAKANKLKPKSTNHYKKLLETRISKSDKEEKPMYKMKMFQDVGSKVQENLKGFKTYVQKKDNLDNLIEKVENELRVLENTGENNN